VHLTQEHVEALFGKGHELTFDRPLSQPGQFLSKEKVTIKNGDRKIERVSILGPVRKASQVEVSKTDSVALRAEGFIRESGDLAGTAPVEIEGPEGSIQLSEGLIIAKRHIHMTPENAAEAGLKDKDVVSVAVNTDGRKTIFRRCCRSRQPLIHPCNADRHRGSQRCKRSPQRMSGSYCKR